jgi:hypothetical protein
MSLIYLELIIDGKSISLNEFAQNILIKLNLAFIELLKLPDNIKNPDDIRSFEVTIQSNESKKFISELIINSNAIVMKEFVQDILTQFNRGIIHCYSDIPQEPKKYKIFYKKE